MPHPGRLLLATALTAAAALTGAVAAAAPTSAAAQPMSRCSTTTGVVLAVDFSHWGGPLLRACGTTPTTGFGLLNEGGWRTTGTQHDGPAFVCRIGYSGFHGGTSYPTAAQDPCVLTPPASAYWSYWHAGPGQKTWSYSQLGAMGYHPAPGSVDLWTFGATNTAGTQGRPVISPDAVRARNTAPAPPATRTPHPGGPAPTTKAPAPPAPGGSTPSTGHGGSASPSTSGPASAAPSASSPAPSAGGVLAGASTGPATRIVDAAPTAAARQSSGSRTPTLIAVALAAVLACAAGLTARRRRRAG